MRSRRFPRRNPGPPVRYMREIAHAETQLMLYSPCPCGSGKRFRFCCRLKPANQEEAKP